MKAGDPAAVWLDPSQPPSTFQKHSKEEEEAEKQKALKEFGAYMRAIQEGKAAASAGLDKLLPPSPMPCVTIGAPAAAGGCGKSFGTCGTGTRS